jgi:hypothetical protein
VPIRNAGIQATSNTECHGIAARTSLRHFLPKGTKVRLSATHKNSTANHDAKGRTRYWRYVDKWVPSTHSWVDVQALLLRHGDVMWLAHPEDPTRIPAYHRYMQEGMATHSGLWDTNHCGIGPSDDANLRLWFNYEADGIDSTNYNGEWMRIQNRGSSDVSIAGWTLRNATRTYNGSGSLRFPSGSVVPAGSYVTVFFGSGTTNPAAGRFYVGIQGTTYLPNVTNPKLGYPGRTMYLVDPQLDFRFVADYPCLVHCATPPPVEIATVQMKTSDEYVDIRVKAGYSSADLSGVVVANDGWTKEITPGTVLNSGETLRVWCDKAGTNSRLSQYWGARSGTMLEDSGDTVVIRTAQSQVIDTYKWGNG